MKAILSVEILIVFQQKSDVSNKKSPCGAEGEEKARFPQGHD
jgi:hypothetical protein